MRRGKEIAQGAHAAMKVLSDRILKPIDHDVCADERCIWYQGYMEISQYMKDWLEGLFTKICLQVESEQELMDVYNKAKEAKIDCALIQDAGLTEFGGIPTYTCCAIGPWDAAQIDQITSHLKLY